MIRDCNFCSEFTVNMISDWFLEAANYCAGNFEAGVDEVDMCGLTTIPSVKVNPNAICAFAQMQFN